MSQKENSNGKIVTLSRKDEPHCLEYAYFGHLEALKKEFELNPQCIEALSQYGSTALMFASVKKHLECVRFLLDKNASVDTRDNYGKTALMYASLEGHVDVVRLLIEYGADKNLKDRRGRTAMMKAARYGREECVVALLEAGALMDVRDKQGYTALHKAADYSHISIFKILIKKGADVTVKTNAGSTALDILRSRPFINDSEKRRMKTLVAQYEERRESWMRRGPMLMFQVASGLVAFPGRSEEENNEFEEAVCLAANAAAGIEPKCQEDNSALYTVMSGPNFYKRLYRFL